MAQQTNADNARANDIDTYGEHDLVNVRANDSLHSNLDISLRVLDLHDERYTETTGKWRPVFTRCHPQAAALGTKIHI